MLNKAAVRACGYTKETPDPPAGEIQRDKSGKQPKLPPEQQMNSSRHFMRELNRLGFTSLVDAGGGSQIYPDDYAIIEELHWRGEMTVRMAYNIFTQSSSTTAKPSPTAASTGRRSGRRRCAGCSISASRWEPAPMPPAAPAITPGSSFTGW
jgi:predicted amidohydrolase YtcJ